MDESNGEAVKGKKSEAFRIEGIRSISTLLRSTIACSLEGRKRRVR